MRRESLDLENEVSMVETWPEAPRRRPGMYIGNTGQTGLACLLYELVSNSADAFLAGKASQVRVDFDDEAFVVTDDGPGLPFDEPSPIGGSTLAEDYLTQPHRTNTADGHAPHVHVVHLGGGLALVTALSSQVDVDTIRPGRRWRQRFERGLAAGPPSSHPSDNPPMTSIRIRPDETIFDSTVRIEQMVRDRLFEYSRLFPGLVIEVGNERFVSRAGLGDLIHAYLRGRSTKAVLTETASVDGIRLQFAASEPHRRNAGEPVEWHAWANGVATAEHGDHVGGVSDALEALGWQPEVALVHVIFDDPQWAGPTRGRLVAPHIRPVLAGHLAEVLASRVSQLDSNRR